MLSRTDQGAPYVTTHTSCVPYRSLSKKDTQKDENVEVENVREY